MLYVCVCAPTLLKSFENIHALKLLFCVHHFIYASEYAHTMHTNRILWAYIANIISNTYFAAQLKTWLSSEMR